MPLPASGSIAFCADCGRPIGGRSVRCRRCSSTARRRAELLGARDAAILAEDPAAPDDEPAGSTGIDAAAVARDRGQGRRDAP